MTIRYRINLSGLARLHCGASRVRGQSAETLPYLPGSAVRGAVAQAWLQQGEGGLGRLLAGVRFGNLSPEGAAPAPVSLRTCSRVPGFRADGGHGVADLLLPLEAAALGGRAGGRGAGAATPAEAPPADADAGGGETEGDGGARTEGGAAGDDLAADPERVLSCPRCAGERRRAGAPETVRWAGFVRWQGGRASGVQPSFDAAYTRAASTRDGSGPTAVRRTLAAGQRFAGLVQFDDEELAARLREQLLPPGATAWLGSDRSRGLGAVGVDGWQEAPPADDLPERLAGLAARLHALAARAGAEVPADATYATLSLRAPALLADAFGRYRLAPSGADLAALLGLPAESLELRQARLGTARVEGWNGALGLPRPDAPALAAGSCWLVRFRGLEADAIIDALGRLERDGVGERRQEGFGELGVCDPLHWRLVEWEEDRPA